MLTRLPTILRQVGAKASYRVGRDQVSQARIATLSDHSGKDGVVGGYLGSDFVIVALRALVMGLVPKISEVWGLLLILVYW